VPPAQQIHSESFILVSGVPPQGGPPAKKTAGLIKKETLVLS
jgi:hypothetical protein